jgi:hypothetical protein
MRRSPVLDTRLSNKTLPILEFVVEGVLQAKRMQPHEAVDARIISYNQNAAVPRE